MTTLVCSSDESKNIHLDEHRNGSSSSTSASTAATAKMTSVASVSYNTGFFDDNIARLLQIIRGRLASVRNGRYSRFADFFSTLCEMPLGVIPLHVKDNNQQQQTTGFLPPPVVVPSLQGANSLFYGLGTKKSWANNEIFRRYSSSSSSSSTTYPLPLPSSTSLLPLQLSSDQKQELASWRSNPNITSTVIHVFGNEHKREIFLTPVVTGLFSGETDHDSFYSASTFSHNHLHRQSRHQLQTSNNTINNSAPPSYYHVQQPKQQTQQQTSTTTSTSSRDNPSPSSISWSIPVENIKTSENSKNDPNTAHHHHHDEKNEPQLQQQQFTTSEYLTAALSIASIEAASPVVRVIFHNLWAFREKSFTIADFTNNDPYFACYVMSIVKNHSRLIDLLFASSTSSNNHHHQYDKNNGEKNSTESFLTPREVIQQFGTVEEQMNVVDDDNEKDNNDKNNDNTNLKIAENHWIGLMMKLLRSCIRCIRNRDRAEISTTIQLLYGYSSSEGSSSSSNSSSFSSSQSSPFLSVDELEQGLHRFCEIFENKNQSNNDAHHQQFINNNNATSPSSSSSFFCHFDNADSILDWLRTLHDGALRVWKDDKLVKLSRFLISLAVLPMRPIVGQEHASRDHHHHLHHDRLLHTTANGKPVDSVMQREQPHQEDTVTAHRNNRNRGGRRNRHN